MKTIALMYHRVCERGPETACYFARGTAVEPAVFREQMAWLAARFEVLAPSRWLRRAASSTAPGADPVVLLTFDDGYRDVIEHVAPICAAFKLPVAIFPIAGHLGAGPFCWVDAWYAIVHRARRRDGFDALPLMPSGEAIPAIDADLRWWVRGPIKQRLYHLDAADRAEALAALADALAAEVPAAEVPAEVPGTSAPPLYCTRADLATLAAAGHDIGGHGNHHHRLAACTAAERADEIAASVALLDALAVPAPRLFCYPDGSHDPATVAAVAASFAAAFTVEPGAIEPTTDRLRLPRFIARNHPPTHPAWTAMFPMA